MSRRAFAGLLLALLVVSATAGCSEGSQAKELNLSRSSLSSQSSSRESLPANNEPDEKEYEALSGQTAGVNDPDPDYEPMDFDQIFSEKDEVAVITLANKIRVENGLEPLKVYAKLTDAARYRALEMYENKYFSHKRPDGSPWYTIYLRELPMEITRIGENLARVSRGADKGRQSPEDWIEMWVNSPEHYKTMMNPTYTHIGVGIYQTEVNGVYYAYAAQEFAVYREEQLQEETQDDLSSVEPNSSGEESEQADAAVVEESDSDSQADRVQLENLEESGALREEDQQPANSLSEAALSDDE